MQLDPISLLKAVPTISPASYTTAQTGAAIDTRGYEYALVVMHFGALTDSATLAVKIQDSTASGDTYADISGAIYNAVENADDTTIKVGLVRLHGKRQFIRAVSTVADTAACAYSVSVILVGPDYERSLRQTYSFEVL